MTETLADRLAEFALSTRFEDLPEAVVAEARRRLLDAFACAAGRPGRAGADDRPAGRLDDAGRAGGGADRRRAVVGRLGGVRQRRPHPLPRLQ